MAAIGAPSAGAVAFQPNGSFTDPAFVFPLGIAADPESGNVYVADRFENESLDPGTIRRYDASGALLSPAAMGAGYYFGVAVQPGGTHAVYGYASSEISAFSASGSSMGSPFSVGPAPLGGIAVDAAGNVYSPNAATHVVDKYTSTGGAGVPAEIGCASGNACGYLPFSEPPYGVAVDGDGSVYVASPVGSERQAVDLSGVTGGSFNLGFEGEETGAEGTGNLAEGSATGSGDLSEGSTTVTNLSTSTGAFEAGQEISGEGVPSDTYIVSIGSGELTLSNAAFSNLTGAELTANATIVSNLNTSAGTFLAGEEVSGSGIPAGTTIVSVGAGQLTLSADATSAGSGVALTAALPYNAPESLVQGALEALSTIGGGGVGVELEGSTYKVTFRGSHEHANVPELTADSTGLQGGSATVETINRAGGGVVKFAPDGSFDSYLYEGDAQALTVDTSSETVLVVGNENEAGWHVTALDYAGNVVGQIPTTSLENVFVTRVAVNPTTETLYVLEFGLHSKVAIYNIIVPPKATTGAASEVTATSATLSGAANPKGSLSEECRFEYTDDADFQANEWANAESAPCDPQPFNEETDVAVSAKITGLTAGTTYDYRVVEETEFGTGEGGAEQFTTLNSPSATTGGASGISQHVATLAGSVNPNGAATTNCHIEWGPSAGNYSTGQAACSPDPGSASTATPVSASASGLAAGTTYHYRVVEKTAAGTANGSDMSFATLADTCASNTALCPPPPAGGGGASTPPPASGGSTPPPVKSKPLTCKKGFKKKKVHGKAKCVKVKQKKHKRKH